MGLKNMSLLSNTTLTASGGDPLVFAEDGVTIQNGLHLIVPSDSDYPTRRQLTVKHRPPTLDPKTGFYSKDKKSMSLTRPMVMSDGRVIFNTIRIEREVHPNLQADEVTELTKVAAQLLIDADTAGFWGAGSLS